MTPFPAVPWPGPVPSPWGAPARHHRRGLPPVGTVLPYAGLLADTDTDADSLSRIRANLASSGWLFCDGSSCARAEYAQLFGVIGTSFGAADAQHFNLPDLRGRFVRGVNGGATQGGGDGGSAPDPQAAGRQAARPGGATGDHVGSAQADCFQGHEHLYTSSVEGEATAEPGAGVPVPTPEPDQSTTSDAAQSADDGSPRVGPETRPINLALNFVIRYA